MAKGTTAPMVVKRRIPNGMRGLKSLKIRDQCQCMHRRIPNGMRGLKWRVETICYHMHVKCILRTKSL